MWYERRDSAAGLLKLARQGEALMIRAQYQLPPRSPNATFISLPTLSSSGEGSRVNRLRGGGVKAGWWWVH
eukprot:2109418-Prymnesium_polylepis.2